MKWLVSKMYKTITVVIFTVLAVVAATEDDVEQLGAVRTSTLDSPAPAFDSYYFYMQDYYRGIIEKISEKVNILKKNTNLEEKDSELIDKASTDAALVLHNLRGVSYHNTTSLNCYNEHINSIITDVKKEIKSDCLNPANNQLSPWLRSLSINTNGMDLPVREFKRGFDICKQKYPNSTSNFTECVHEKASSTNINLKEKKKTLDMAIYELDCNLKAIVKQYRECVADIVNKVTVNNAKTALTITFCINGYGCKPCKPQADSPCKEIRLLEWNNENKTMSNPGKPGVCYMYGPNTIGS